MKDNWKVNLNVPNFLTLLRFLMIPLYIVLFIRGYKYLALATFLLAGLTDILDGIIARKFNLITNLGKLMDPLADKLMGITALFSMALGTKAIAPVVPWPVLIVILSKELLMMLGGLFMLGYNIVVYSRPIGKAAQALLTTGLTATFFHEYLNGLWGLAISPDVLLLYAAMTLTLAALFFYAAQCVKTISGGNVKHHGSDVN